MALYVITDGDGDTESIVLNGVDNLKEMLKELYDEGSYDFDGDEPSVYQLGKKMKVSVETVVTLKEAK